MRVPHKCFWGQSAYHVWGDGENGKKTREETPTHKNNACKHIKK